MEQVLSSIKGVIKAHPTVHFWANRVYRRIYPPEERWLAELAKSQADIFFLQIGAHDGKTDDKLYPFARARSWKGVLIEPVPYLFDRLVANYASSTGMIFENKALMAKDGEALMYRLRETEDPLPPWYDQLCSFNRDVIMRHKKSIPNIEDYLIEERVECISFATLVARHRIDHIDLILIDTEGYDLEILKTIDFHRFHPKLVIYEQKHLSHAEKVAAVRLLERNAYAVHRSGANNIAHRHS